MRTGRRLLAELLIILLLLALCGCSMRDSAGAAETEQRVLIDPALTLHEVPAIRGVMTEWMYDEGDEITVDPRGVQFGYGKLVPLKEADIARAAEVGINTVRCAISHTSLEADDKPGVYIERGFARIKEQLDWYDKYGINGILDLHNPLGRQGGGDPRIWKEKAYQDRFVNVWKEIVTRFKDHPRVIAYEPINEPEPRYTDDWNERFKVWNDLAKRVTAAIREIDPAKPIIIDCTEYAFPLAFEGLEPTGDKNTIYSFHWYYPYQFHCQKRPFIQDKETYHYPGEFPTRIWKTAETFEPRWWNRKTLAEEMQVPLDFAAKYNAPLFCGEFGCVSDVPEMEDMVWLLDLVSLFDENNIGWTYYHYMFRTPEPYWKDHFDCNMFIYESDTNKLRPFDRKVSLLGDLFKLRGAVISVKQPQDEWMTVYGVTEPAGQVRVYVSNKSRDDSKTIKLKLAGERWPNEAGLQIMKRGSGGFEDAPPPAITEGVVELKLEPLSIARLRISR